MSTAGSLFSGYGGIDLAVMPMTGARLAWHCDNDPDADRVLARHHPGVPNLGDITVVDWTAVEPVDILTGGFPCQDISSAGKRAGIEGARSGLWRYFADAIRLLRPRLVFLENVSALLVRGLDRVLADLAEIGYDVRWTCVRASDVGAPHRRERWFAVAYPADDGLEWDWGAWNRRTGSTDGSVAAADTHHSGPQRPQPTRRPDLPTRRAAADASGDAVREQPEPIAERGSAPFAGLNHAPAPDTQGDGRHQGWTEPAWQFRGLDAAISGDAAPADANRRRFTRDQERDVRSESGLTASRRRNAAGRVLDWGKYEPAIRRWEHILGRGAPVPTVTGKRGGQQLNPVFVEWMMGLPGGYVTAVPGLSRNAMLRLLGNGVVPQQAEYAIRGLLARLASKRVA